MSESEIEKIIANLRDPRSEKTLAELKALSSICQTDKTIQIKLLLPYPSAGLQDFWQAQIADLFPDYGCQVELSHKIRRHQCLDTVSSHPKIKNIIAIASCKGGVGKSTTTVGLAYALQAQGARVGILDADIYGPNIPDLLRISASAAIKDKKFQPVVIDGIETMSIAYCIDDGKPAIWRGPMVSGALEQLYKQTQWGKLDYLLIDLPPGTGDVQLTFSKKIPTAGVIMVTTAETLALVDTIKGIEMFDKVGIKTLGLIENMASHKCEECGHSAAIFGDSSVRQIAERYSTALLANIAFDSRLQQKADAALLPEIYAAAARKFAVQLGLQAPTYRVQFADVINKSGGKSGDKS
jgi:ATP-binding protein involved in chromosome partitioning